MDNFLANIKAALGDCKRLNTSDCKLKTSYEIINEPKFFIYDDNKNDRQPIRIILKHGLFQLTVQNKSNSNICVIKVDKCLIIDDKYKRCDCILFDQHKLYFIEISDAGDRSSKRRHAVDQLESTIQILKGNNVDFSRHETKAIICFRSERKNPTQASSNAKRVIFKEKHNVDLEEGGKIYF